MYHLLGVERNIETNLLLSSLGGVFPKSTSELKSCYRKYLSSIQSHDVVSKRPDGIEFVWDMQEGNRLIELFGVKSKLNDLGQETVISREISVAIPEIKAKSEAAVKRLEEIDPVLYSLFQLTIEKIFYAGSSKAGGGSSSAAIGCIWLNSRPSWTEQDYLEFFVHELTHNLVFLDERREPHYPHYELLEKTENFAYSAILRRARPLDKTVHSLIVVYEVLSFRMKHFDITAKTFLHPDTMTLFAGAKETIQSLETINPSLMSEHLKELISIVDVRLKELKKDLYVENFNHL